MPALASGLEARCGVTTGEAAVLLGAANQGMVTGDIVNTAARLQSAAEPSSMLVGEATFRAASGAIAFDARDALQLKGKLSVGDKLAPAEPNQARRQQLRERYALSGSPERKRSAAGGPGGR